MNALGRLHDLAVFVGEGEDLGARLEELVGLAASVTDASACSIMLLSEGEHDAPRLKLWCSTQALPASAHEERPGPGEAIAGRVLEQGDALPFGETDLRLAQIVATLIGKSVQVERLQTLLRSRVAHASLAREEKAVVTRLTDGTVPPARLAKLLARSFFRDLSAAGFEPGQIVDAASEIVGLVSADLGRFRRRKEGGR